MKLKALLQWSQPPDAASPEQKAKEAVAPAAEKPVEPTPTPTPQKRPVDAAQSSRLINRIIENFGFTDYLEVGVQNGVTFHAVNAIRRDAVDPNFLFDPIAHAAKDVRFYPITSDNFFAEACDKTYDLIFLDGLHTFEQCYRDFCAALQVLREPGVIIVDDTVPDNFFSTLPTQDDAIRAREDHGLSGRAWTGDVFKTVMMLHDFYPNLDFATLSDPENLAHKPNTVVWRARRAEFQPMLCDVTRIAAATYFDLPRLAPAFRWATVDEGLGRLFAAKSVG